MSGVNPYELLLRMCEALPESERLFLTGVFLGVTSDTGRSCGCIFGQLDPPSLGDEEHRTVDAYRRMREVPRFAEWLAQNGISYDVAREVEDYNDRFAVYHLPGPHTSNTESVCLTRFKNTVEWLRERAGQYEKEKS